MTTKQKMVAIFLIAVVAIGSSIHESRRANRLEQQLVSAQAQPTPEPVVVVKYEQPPAPPAIIAKPGKVLSAWQQIESADYRQYMANLRAVGCPEQTIQDIVAAEVTRLYATRAKELRGANTNRYEYWKPRNYGYSSLVDKQTIEALMALGTEKRAVLKELLGAEVPEPLDAWPPYLNCWELQLDFLPAEKQAKVLALEQQINAQVLANPRAFNEGDGAERDRALAEKEVELSKILSPEEKFEYDLRLSPSTGSVNIYLGDFEPTEQEFREMVRLRLLFDRELGLPKPTPSPEGTARRKAAQKELEQQYRLLLGEARYKELKAARH